MDCQYSIAVHNSSDVKEELHSSQQQPATMSSPVNPQPMEGLQGTGPPPFLTKTYDMVEDPITNGVVSWSTTNNSFVVWNSHQFSLDLLPKYFKHNNFSSFVRQLNTYGFRKVHPDRWEFANEGFLRGQKHLLKHIHRRKPPSQGQQQQQQGVGACIEVGQFGMEGDVERLRRDKNVLMVEVVKLRQQQQSTKSQLQVMGQRLQATEQRQQQMMTFLARAMQNPTFLAQLVQHGENNGKRLAGTDKKKRRRLTQHENQLPPEVEGNESSSDGHEIVKYNSNTPISSDSVKPQELVMQNSKYLHSILFSGMENSVGGGQRNEVRRSNSTGESSMKKNSLDNGSRTPQSVAEIDQLAKDNEMGELSLENSYSLEMALQRSDKFASQQGDTVNITEAYPSPPPPHQDLDFKSSSDVFWEELLNENFDSQEDSEAEAEVDGNFPDYDKGEDSSIIRDTNFPWDKGIDINRLSEQMGKMGHIPSRSKALKQ